MLHQARKKKKRKKTEKHSQLPLEAGRQKGRKKSCIPGVESIHILFIYIVVRNDAKDATTTAAPMAAAAAAAAGAEGNNSCNKLWHQKQKWLLCFTRAASMEDRRRTRKGGHCACAVVCNHDNARELRYQKFRVCGGCMPLSPSKLSIFIFIFMPIMFPFKFVNFGGSKLFFFHANYVPFKFVNFWEIKFYFSFHANYVAFKLVIFWGVKKK